MDKYQIKRSIDDWHLLLEKQRGSLIERGLIELPSKRLGLALTGVRRSGKTSQAILTTRQISLDGILYYNFEDPLFLDVSSPLVLNQLVEVAQEFRSEPIEVLILDEIHNVKGWESWVRTIIDQQRYSVIVTGSSSRLLSSELASSLTGRCLEKRIWPLSFSEFLQFSRDEVAQELTREMKLSRLREYMTWGGFPEVVRQTDQVNKTLLLRQYFSDILFKDVMRRHEIRNQRLLEQISTYYQTNISSLHSHSSVANAFSASVANVSRYTKALEDGFLCFELERYHKNLKVQARDPRKIYSIDLGFRNVSARSYNPDYGKILENIVFLELKRRGLDIMYYMEDSEVDFIVTEGYQPVLPIQVSLEINSNPRTRKRELDGIESCMERLGLQEGIIVTLNEEENVNLKSSRKVRIVPAWKWLLTVY